MEKCPMCQGTLVPREAAEGFVCTECFRVWVQRGDEWETLPSIVSVDETKLKEGEKYADAVKVETPAPSITAFRLRLDMFINSISFIRPSREVSLAHTHLQRAFMWLGKAQGATGSESPYKESFNHKTPAIEPTADQSGSNLFLYMWKDNEDYGTHTARVKSLRQNISDHLRLFKPFAKAPNIHSDDYAEYLKQSRLAAEEASMWLGWELARIKKEQENPPSASVAQHPASGLPL